MKTKTRTRTRKSRTEWLQNIIDQYRKATGAETIDMLDVADWAIKKQLWQVTRRDIRRQCAHELARAARDQYYEDPQGRRVRKKHAVRQMIQEKAGKKQLVLWGDIETAPPEHMRLSLQQRRMYIVGDCKQLKTDCDSYNENNVHGAHIQMAFDFREDLEEMELPSEYPDTKPKE